MFLALAAGAAQAQQKPQYTQYTLNNYLLNPAITGIEDYADLKLGTRHQWSGLEGAPESYYATLHMPVNKDMTASYQGPRRRGAARHQRRPPPSGPTYTAACGRTTAWGPWPCPREQDR